MQPFCAANPSCNPLSVELQAAPGCASFCSSSTGQPSASMAARSWVASSTGRPSTRSRSRAMLACRAAGSIPVKGSSSSRVSPGAQRARSRAVRRFCPPLSFRAGRASAASSSHSRAKSCRMAASCRSSGSTSSTFCTAVSWGQSRSSWNTALTRPAPCTRPAVGVSSPMRMRRRVVLPQPLGAHSTAGPSTVKVRSRNSTVLPKHFSRWSMVSMRHPPLRQSTPGSQHPAPEGTAFQRPH